MVSFKHLIVLVLVILPVFSIDYYVSTVWQKIKNKPGICQTGFVSMGYNSTDNVCVNATTTANLTGYVQKWESWDANLNVTGQLTSSSAIVSGVNYLSSAGLGVVNGAIAVYQNASAPPPALYMRNYDPGALSFTDIRLGNDIGDVGDIFTTTPAMNLFIPGYGNSLVMTSAGTSKLILGSFGSGDVNIISGGVFSRMYINSNGNTTLGTAGVSSNLTVLHTNVDLGTSVSNTNLRVYGNTRSDNYFSGDNSQGITSTSSYWLCTSSNCSTTCQVQIKDGLITGCV